MRLIIYFLMFGLTSCVSSHKYTWTAELNINANQAVLVNAALPDSKNQMLIQNETFTTPLQRINNDQWTFLAPSHIVADQKFDIVPIAESITDTPCKISSNSDFITAKINNQEILKYAINTQYPPDTLPGYYKRSGFIHPLKTLDGNTLTAGFPRGHTHQHGVFHAWTRSHVRDSMIDFWNQQAELGTIRHKDVLEINNGPVFSSFKVGLEYLAFIDGDTVIVSEDIWDLKIYPVEQFYFIDWQITQTCLGPDTLFLDMYHYGGTAFRGAEEWNVEGGAYDSLVYFITNEGKTSVDGNHSRPVWVAMHGTTQHGYGGVAFIPHRNNFRYPQPVRVHPTMPYFCFAPMVLGEFELPPGHQYQVRHRILVYDGKPPVDYVGELASSF